MEYEEIEKWPEYPEPEVNEDNPKLLQSPYALLPTMNNKNDLKLKISKLEAYSRQLCLNLKDLQKNREDITSKTLALTEELQSPRSNGDFLSQTDVHVLLHAKKTGCCAICKGCAEWETDWEGGHDEEETEDLREPLNISSVEDLATSECCCCVCCENRISQEYICDECNGCEANFRTVSSSNVSFENFQRAEQASRRISDLSYFRSDIDESSVARGYKICSCERESTFDEKCRLPADREFSISSYIMKMEKTEGTSPSNESLSLKNFRDSLAASLPSNLASKSYERLKKSDAVEEENIEVPGCNENSQKSQQDKMLEKVFRKSDEASLKNPEIPDNAIFDPRIEDDPKEKISNIERSSLVRCLAAIEELSRGKKVEKMKLDGKTCKKDLFMGLLVLILIVFSHASRFQALSSMASYANNVLTYFWEIFHRPVGQILHLPQFIPELIKSFNREYTRGQWDFGKHVDSIWSRVSFFAAVLGSISFAKSFWTPAKLLFSTHKNLPESWGFSEIQKSYKSTERSVEPMTFIANSQYRFSFYFFFLTIGFVLAKVSVIIDDWSFRNSGNYNSLIEA